MKEGVTEKLICQSSSNGGVLVKPAADVGQHVADGRSHEDTLIKTDRDRSSFIVIDCPQRGNNGRGASRYKRFSRTSVRPKRLTAGAKFTGVEEHEWYVDQ